MRLFLKVLWCFTVIASCYCSTTTTGRPTDQVLSVNVNQVHTPINHKAETPHTFSNESDSNESSGTGISHIIKHSKLFTEFISFAVNPLSAIEHLKTYLPAAESNHTSGNKSSTAHLEPPRPPVQSNGALQQLFVELMKRNSPGFIVSFDYSAQPNNQTNDNHTDEAAHKKPVRIWGLVPDEEKSKTLYFMSNYYYTKSLEAETKPSAQLQIEDFEDWKNKTLKSIVEVPDDDKLGDGLIGTLLGGKH